MAENLETPQSFGNFSIENTMEMGLGNAELLNDLMSPETSTTSPDDIKEMTTEDKAPKAEPTPKKSSSKSIGETMDEAPEKKEETSIQDFLLGGDEEEEEEEEAAPAKQKTEASTPASEDNDETDEPEVSKFGALANDLFKLGVFSKEDDEEDEAISTPEEFLERFQVEKKKGAIEVVNNFIGQFGEDYQQAFEAIFVKGVDPKEYFGTYNNITNFAELDLGEESNQIAVLKQALSDQGFDPEDVGTEIERLKNYGDLESVATKHHKVLVKKEAAKLQQLEQQSERELQQKAAIKNQYISNVQSVLQEKLKAKEFDGIPLNPKLAGELQDFLLVDKYKTNSGETLTDFDRTILELKRPENHANKVKVALLLKILEKDPTLSTIQKSGISKKSNELFGEVARQVSKNGNKTSGGSQKNTSWFV
jgi:hypothetical protein